MLKFNSLILEESEATLNEISSQLSGISGNLLYIRTHLGMNLSGTSDVQNKLKKYSSYLQSLSEATCSLSAALVQADSLYQAADVQVKDLDNLDDVFADVSTESVVTSKTGDEYLQEINDRYEALLKENNRTTYSKNCSAHVTDQLLYLGIIADEDGRVAYGKDYYSTWSSRLTTTTGYSVESYEGSAALSELLASHEGESLENIVISFNATTKNSAGHVIFISAIKDGYVYFSDSTASLKLNGKYYVSGEARCCTVEEFLSTSYYKNMNGVVYFHQ